MSLTKTEARSEVMRKARAYIGYNPGRTYSLFGAWYGWPNALWCAAGCSKPFYEALGYDLAVQVIGYQDDGPNQRGWIWTVKFRQWLQANGTRISLKDVQEGDLLFFKYPTDDPRNENPVNHVDLVNGNQYHKGYIPTLGPNTPRPGTPGDPSDGRGFWRHNRSIADPYIVDAYRPNWDAVSESEDELSAEDVEKILDRVDTLRGERTNAHVKEVANQEKILDLLEKIFDQNNVLGRQNAQIRDALKALDNGASTEEIVEAIFTHTQYDLGFGWWSRLGLVLDKDHPQYPADPGSLADMIIQTFEATTDQKAEIYDGTQKRLPPSVPHKKAAPRKTASKKTAAKKEATNG